TDAPSTFTLICISRIWKGGSSDGVSGPGKVQVMVPPSGGKPLVGVHGSRAGGGRLRPSTSVACRPDGSVSVILVTPLIGATPGLVTVTRTSPSPPGARLVGTVCESTSHHAPGTAARALVAPSSMTATAAAAVRPAKARIVERNGLG